MKIEENGNGKMILTENIYIRFNANVSYIFIYFSLACHPPSLVHDEAAGVPHAVALLSLWRSDPRTSRMKVPAFCGIHKVVASTRDHGPASFYSLHEGDSGWVVDGVRIVGQLAIRR